MALSSGNLAYGKRAGNVFLMKTVAAAVIYAGGIAALYEGFAKPAAAGAGADNTAKAADAAKYRVVGVFTENAKGGEQNGDVSVNIENAGVYLLKNSTGGDEITASDIESACYVIDDETVAKTNPNNTRPKAGIVKQVDEAGVWVQLGHSA